MQPAPAMTTGSNRKQRWYCTLCSPWSLEIQWRCVTARRRFGSAPSSLSLSKALWPKPAFVKMLPWKTSRRHQAPTDATAPGRQTQLPASRTGGLWTINEGTAQSLKSKRCPYCVIYFRSGLVVDASLQGFTVASQHAHGWRPSQISGLKKEPNARVFGTPR